jgi:hypothetical protein
MSRIAKVIVPRAAIMDRLKLAADEIDRLCQTIAKVAKNRRENDLSTSTCDESPTSYFLDGVAIKSGFDLGLHENELGQSINGPHYKYRLDVAIRWTWDSDGGDDDDLDNAADVDLDKRLSDSRGVSITWPKRGRLE